MKRMILLALVSLSMASWAGGKPQVRTVEKVDLDRYLGEWFEIAAIPQSFQKMCVKNVKAQYSLTELGLIKVVNSCETIKGETKIANARAKVIDKKSNAKLKVTFVKIFDWVFSLGGNYWILDLAEDYSFVVVGDPTREFGWILGRTKDLAPVDLARAKHVLEANGYDVCQFLTTIQDGAEEDKKSLCE